MTSVLSTNGYVAVSVAARADINCASIPLRILGCGCRLRPLPENVSRSGAEFWDAVSAWRPIRKAHPTLGHNSGTQFPPEAPSGKCVPFWSWNLGCSFRLKADPESASRSERAFRDAVPARGPIGKAHPTPGLDSGSCFSLDPLPKTASHSDAPQTRDRKTQNSRKAVLS